MPNDVIPLKFQKASGIQSHTFRVCAHRFYGSLDQLKAFPVYIRESSDWVPYLASLKLFPREVEALAILSSVDGETERQGRYINIHSAYEAVVHPRDVTLSAIRHALAHPITALTRPAVQEALLSRFGTLRIDLRKYEHQKAVYCAIGAMLIAIDNAVYQSFSARATELVPAVGT